MNGQFEKFTERARKVLSLAQDEAQRFNHNYIGTEHLLLGLVREGDGVAAKVLANLGVELQKVRSAVEFIIGRGDRIVLGEIGLTPRAKKVIELAVDEARRLNHHYIGTEHLLLGLVREGEGIAAGVLESLGVNLEKVRVETIRVLGRTGPESVGSTDTGWTLQSSIGPHAISRESRALSTILLVGAALLLGVGVATMANNIAYGVPGSIGLDIPLLSALLGGLCLLQAAGMLLVTRAQRPHVIGYILVGVSALLWIAASILDRLHIVSAAAPYHDSLLAQGLAYTTIGLGMLVVITSVVATVFTRFNRH